MTKTNNIFYLINPKYGEGYQGKCDPDTFVKSMKILGINLDLHHHIGKDGIEWYSDENGEPVFVMPGHPAAPDEFRLDAFTIEVNHNSQDITGTIVFYEQSESKPWGWYTYQTQNGIFTENDDVFGYETFTEAKEDAIKNMIECDLEPEDIDSWFMSKPNQRIMKLMKTLKQAGYSMKLHGGDTQQTEPLSIDLEHI